MHRIAVSAASVALCLVVGSARAEDSWAERWLVGSRAVAVLGAGGGEAARARAAGELGVVGASRPAVRALLAARDDPSPTVARAVDAALVRRGDRDVVSGLVTALAHSAGEDRLALRHALAAIGDDAAARAVVGQIAAGDPDLTLEADLARLGPGAVPRLLHAAAETHGSPAVLEALGAIGDPRALPTLIAALRTDSTPVRIAAALALRDLGDPRASPALAAALNEPSPAALTAMLLALAVVGEPAAAPAIRLKLAHPDADVRVAALRALVGVDSSGALPSLREASRGTDAALAATAHEILLTTRHAVLAPLLAGETRGAEVAGALAVLDDEAGIPALLACAAGTATSDRARRGGSEGQCVLALAIAARMSTRDRAPLVAAIVRGRGHLDPDTALVARALALDAAVVPYLLRELSSVRATRRATAAHALALVARAAGVPRAAAGSAVARALSTETDAEAFRREADAVLALGGIVDVDGAVVRATDPEIAPEALALLGHGVAAADPAHRRAALAALHEALRGDDPRTRAAAAHALVDAAGRGAARTLLAALADETDAHVRLAIATAVGSLGVDDDAELRAIAAGLARATTEPEIREALLAPAGVAEHGREVLHVRFAGGTRDVRVDVRLPDGRTVRIAPLPGGDLLLADLPLGTADVLATGAP